MPGNNTDELLVAALKLGSQEAMAMLYDKYACALLGVLCKMTGNKDVSEETLQHCFMKIWQEKDQYNPAKERLFTWMLKITREVAKSIPVQETKDTKNQNKANYVGSDNTKTKDSELIMGLMMVGHISEQEAALKTGAPLHQVRNMLRKEINQLRRITVE